MDDERIRAKKRLILDSMLASIFTTPVLFLPFLITILSTIKYPKVSVYLSYLFSYALSVIILFYMQKASDYKKVYYEHLETIRALRYELKDKNRECGELKGIIDAARKKAGD